jgi:hypothetical protein
MHFYKGAGCVSSVFSKKSNKIQALPPIAQVSTINPDNIEVLWDEISPFDIQTIEDDASREIVKTVKKSIFDRI